MVVDLYNTLKVTVQKKKDAHNQRFGGLTDHEYEVEVTNLTKRIELFKKKGKITTEQADELLAILNS